MAVASHSVRACDVTEEDSDAGWRGGLVLRFDVELGLDVDFVCLVCGGPRNLTGSGGNVPSLQGQVGTGPEWSLNLGRLFS